MVGGGSFSNRRFVDYSYIYIIATALSFAEIKKYISIPIAAGCSLWTTSLMLAERKGILSLDHYNSYKEITQDVYDILSHPLTNSKFFFGNFASLTIPERDIFVFALVVLVIICLALLQYWSKIKNIQKIKNIALTAAIIFIVLANVNMLYSAIKTVPLNPAAFPKNISYKNAALWNNYYEYGFYLLNKGRFEEAVEVYKKAINLAPYLPYSYRYLGSTYLELGEYDKAIEAFQTAIKIYPDYQAAKELLKKCEAIKEYKAK